MIFLKNSNVIINLLLRTYLYVQYRHARAVHLYSQAKSKRVRSNDLAK